MELYTCPCCGYKTLDEMPPGKMSVSRENVAKFMYAATRQNQLIGKMPIVYNN